MPSWVRLICYIFTALLTATYWIIAGSVCYRMTGVDPLSVWRGSDVRAGIVTIAIMVMFLIAFALTGRWFERRWQPNAHMPTDA